MFASSRMVAVAAVSFGLILLGWALLDRRRKRRSPSGERVQSDESAVLSNAALADTVSSSQNQYSDMHVKQTKLTDELSAQKERCLDSFNENSTAAATIAAGSLLNCLKEFSHNSSASEHGAPTHLQDIPAEETVVLPVKKAFMKSAPSGSLAADDVSSSMDGLTVDSVEADYHPVTTSSECSTCINVTSNDAPRCACYEISVLAVGASTSFSSTKGSCSSGDAACSVAAGVTSNGITDSISPSESFHASSSSVVLPSLSGSIAAVLSVEPSCSHHDGASSSSSYGAAPCTDANCVSNADCSATDMECTSVSVNAEAPASNNCAGAASCSNDVTAAAFTGIPLTADDAWSVAESDSMVVNLGTSSRYSSLSSISVTAASGSEGVESADEDSSCVPAAEDTCPAADSIYLLDEVVVPAYTESLFSEPCSVSQSCVPPASDNSIAEDEVALMPMYQVVEENAILPCEVSPLAAQLFAYKPNFSSDENHLSSDVSHLEADSVSEELQSLGNACQQTSDFLTAKHVYSPDGIVLQVISGNEAHASDVVQPAGSEVCAEEMDGSAGHSRPPPDLVRSNSELLPSDGTHPIGEASGDDRSGSLEVVILPASGADKVQDVLPNIGTAVLECGSAPDSVSAAGEHGLILSAGSVIENGGLASATASEPELPQLPVASATLTTVATSNGIPCEARGENVITSVQPVVSSLPNEAHSTGSVSKETSLAVFRFYLPSAICGLFIGKKGRNVISLKEKSGAQIRVDGVATAEDLHVCIIRGTPDSVERALIYIAERFPQLTSAMSVGEFVSSPAGLHSGSQVSTDRLQLQLAPGTPVDVLLSAVVSATHVFVQLPTHPTYASLERLSLLLRECYSDVHSAPPALPAPVEAGSICVAQSGDAWYRAAIVQRWVASDQGDSGEELFQIKYVDYGGYEVVPLSCLRQIRTDFVTLPFQAIECFLAHLRLVRDDVDSLADSQIALQPYTGHLLGCENVGIDATAGIPLVELYASNGGDAVHINKFISRSGVAVWTD